LILSGCLEGGTLAFKRRHTGVSSRGSRRISRHQVVSDSGRRRLRELFPPISDRSHRTGCKITIGRVVCGWLEKASQVQRVLKVCTTTVPALDCCIWVCDPHTPCCSLLSWLQTHQSYLAYSHPSVDVIKQTRCTFTWDLGPAGFY
jgi:hypothetical protein